MATKTATAVKKVRELTEAVLSLRLWVEAAIDFPEEEIDFLADRGLGERMSDLRSRFRELDTTARQGALLRDGLTLVIAGRPNAGRDASSSLTGARCSSTRSAR